MTQVTVRDAVPSDLPQLVEIYNYYVTNTPITFDLVPVTLEQRKLWLDEHGPSGRHRLLVCVEDGALAGYASSHRFRVKPAYETTVETSCYCAPLATGRGLGTQLYRALFEALRGEDIRSFIAGITLPNPASIALHQSFGFVPVGTMHAVGRKFGQYWDVSWFERLNPHSAG
jgi:phosphinothricin acetyltransferase